MQYDVSFGRLSKTNRAQPGPALRLAVLGDFSCHANAGVLETGETLAARKPHRLDIDTMDGLIARLSPTILVPIDEAGKVLTAPIRTMDDFHPDQLVENLPVFEDLLELRRDLGSRTGFERAAKQVLSWSGETALPSAPVRRARGGAIATDKRLSDFARLTGRKPSAEVATEDLIRRLIGPLIVPERDARQDALVARVDAALSDAMRRLLHNPDFQYAEALWRGVEFMARRVETDAALQIVLYDISAEELAADLAGSDALEQSALYALLVEQPPLDAYQGPLSLIAGLYQFEATPPHADLLGRIAQVAAAAGAPFVAGIGSEPLKAPLHEWHPLTRRAWDALRGLPASAYLGLVTPRFLLRMPYGKKTDPIEAFAFEEFTRQSGLSGMLWGHPSLLVACLVAESWRRNGKAMKLGDIATVGDLPVYVYHDADGEQIALPCTERLFSERQAAQIAGTGVNPVVSLRGRPEVRVGGFRSLAGGTLAGRWAPVDVTAAPCPPTTDPAPATAALAGGESQGKTTQEPPAQPDAEPAPLESPATAAADSSEAAVDDLDALLASLTPQASPPAADQTEPDLDALLASLK